MARENLTKKEAVEKVAEQLFNAYNETGENKWKTWDGKDVPRWPDITPQVREKWCSAAAIMFAAESRMHALSIEKLSLVQDVKTATWAAESISDTIFHLRRKREGVWCFCPTDRTDPKHTPNCDFTRGYLAERLAELDSGHSE